MSEISERYARLCTALAEVLAAVPADRWEADSPCEGWTTRDVARHLVDSSGMFLGFIGRDAAGAPSVDDDPLGAFVAVTGEVQRALEDPAAAGTTFDGLGGPTRFEDAAGRFLVVDLIVHRWDLARGAGLRTTFDDDELAVLWGFLDAMGDTLYSSGACAPALPCGGDADEQTKVLAKVGRQA